MRPLSSRQTLQCISSWLVVVSGWVVGHAASEGMSHHQWAAAGLAILGSISLAAFAHTRPQAERQRG
jgi:hypothetical protein